MFGAHGSENELGGQKDRRTVTDCFECARALLLAFQINGANASFRNQDN